MSRWATGGLRPDLTVLLDIPASVGPGPRARPRGRRQARGRAARRSTSGCAQAFRHLAESDPRRYLVVDATRPVDEIAAEIRYVAVDGLCNQPPPPEPCSHDVGSRTGRADERFGTRWSGRTRRSRCCAARPQAAAEIDPRPAGQPGRDDARLAVHRAAGSGRSVAARAFAAALQCERDDDIGCGECAACRTVRARQPSRRAAGRAGGPVDLGRRDAGGGGRVRPPPGARPLAGRRHRGRRPADRAGVQRPAQGGGGAGRAHRVPAVRAVDASGRRVGDDPVALPAGVAAHTAGGGRGRGAAARRARRGHAPTGPPRPGRVTSAARAGWPATPTPATAGPRCWPFRRR